MKLFYSFAQKVTELRLNSLPSLGRVLMFHQIREISEYREPSLAITPDNFRKLISSLMERNYNFVSPNSLLNLDRLNEKYVILTFDDVFCEVYTIVLPFLRDRKIPFTIFVTVGLVGNEDYINETQLLEFGSYPLCTVGAHSMTHPILRPLAWDASYKELQESKITLENCLSRDICYLAYPYGSFYACSSKETKLAEVIGFHLAFSTVNAHISGVAQKNFLFIPRIAVNDLNVQKMLM